LADDPYTTPDAYPERPNKACGLIVSNDAGNSYQLETFDSRGALEATGAWLTHDGACGQCSSLQDLAVYIEQTDLTTPVRQCGIDHLNGEMQDHIACIAALGFSDACAQIWYYNSRNTQQTCLTQCLSALGADYHNADGTLNDCILCDEENSGPVFKAVSGRTRRNSGLPTALCRPCSTISRIQHDYGLR
jgi:hypothetical protein